MSEISRSVQIVKQAKKIFVDCTVRTDAELAGSYDTWQMLSLVAGVELAVMWMNYIVDTWHICGKWIGDTWPKRGLPRVTLGNG
jgi:hypothetical protein